MGSCRSQQATNVANPGNIEAQGNLVYPIDNELVYFRSSKISEEIEGFVNNPSYTIDEKQDFLIKNYNLYLKRHSQAVASIIMTPDCKSLISASKDKTVKIWELSSLKQTSEITHNFEVNQVAISPDCKYLYSLSDNREISQWNFSTSIKENSFRNFEFRIRSFAVSPTGHELFLGGGFLPSDNFCPIHVFDIKSTKIMPGFYGHRASANALVITNDHKYMISCSGGHYVAVQDNSVRLWSLSSKKNIATYCNFVDSVNCVGFANRKKIIIAGSRDRSIHMLNFNMEKLEILRGHESSIEALAIVPSENQFVSGSLDSTLRIWDLDKHRLLFQLNTSSIFSLVCNASHVFAGAMCNIKSLNLSNYAELDLQGHNGRIDLIFMEPKSKYLVTGATKTIGGDATIRIWNLATQTQECVLSYPHGIKSVNLTHDGKGLRYVCENGEKKYYSVRGEHKWVKHKKAFDFVLIHKQRIKIR